MKKMVENGDSGVLYISNHPESSKMIIPVLKFAIANPGLNIISIPVFEVIIKSLPIVKINPIPVETSMKSRTKFNSIVQKVITGLLGKNDSISGPVSNASELAIDALSQGEDLFISPAGKAMTEESEDWHAGVGHILIQAFQANPELCVAFLYIDRLGRSKLSDSFRVDEIEQINQIPKNDSGLFVYERAEVTKILKRMFNRTHKTDI
jgi:hypothetical protein